MRTRDNASLPLRTHRPHTKSRNGCVTCKSRKVKCDERLPACTNCIYRETPCFYKDVTALDRTSKADSTTGAPKPSPGETGGVWSAACLTHTSFGDFFSRLPRSPLTNGPAVTHSLLVSEYCHRTGRSLAAASTTELRIRIWRDVIPALGFKHEVVSHAIMAVAALSICSTQCHQRKVAVTIRSSPRSHTTNQSCNFSQPYLNQAHIHYGRCLQKLREEITCLGQGNLSAVLACSALLIPYGLAYSQFERQRLQVPRWQSADHNSFLQERSLHDECRHGDEQPLLDLTWMYFMRGVSTLTTKVFQHVPSLESPIMPLFEESEDDLDRLESELGPRVWLKPDYAGGTTLSNHDLLPIILDEGPPVLQELQTKLKQLFHHHGTPRDGKISPLYGNLKASLASLGCLQVALEQFATNVRSTTPQPFFRILTSWIARKECSFIDLLAKQDIFALAMYAHFLVYMILLEDLWWVGDLGMGTLRIILDLVYGCPNCGKQRMPASPELQKMFAWPANIVTLYKNTRDRRWA